MSKEIFNRLIRIDHLIRIKGTGSPKQLAHRMNIGERTLYDYIGTMKRLGAPIKFCKIRNTYYYDEEGEFIIGFNEKHIKYRIT